MKSALSHNLIVNTLWSFFGRFGYLAVGLISNIALVRLLSPKEFGQMGVLMFFIAIAAVLIESGLAGALVRKQDVTERDYGTVFIFNMVISIALMCLLMSASGAIAEFYKEPGLEKIIMCSSVVLVINAFRITQTTKLIKQLRFRAKAAYELIAITLASVLSVVLATYGAGVWALVAFQVSLSLVLTCLLWVSVGGVGSYSFSTESFKKLYKFGINTTIASLLNSAFDNIYQLVLAKYFSMQQAGFFYQAKKLQEMPTGILQGAMLGVVYSTLSRLQESPDEFNNLYQQAVKYFTVMVALICSVVFFYSELIVEILYGREWLASALYLKDFSGGNYMFWSVCFKCGGPAFRFFGYKYS